jgi:cytochrome P450
MTAAQRALPPGPSLGPSLQTLLFWRRLDPFLRACARKHGPTFTLHIFPWGTTVVLSDPDSLRAVLTGSPEVWRAGESYELLAPLIGERSVVVLDGEEHLRVRKKLLAPFHGDMVARYQQLIETIALEEVERWPLNTPISLLERMGAITLEVMLRTVIGAEDPRRLRELRSSLAEAVRLKPLVLLMWVYEPLARIGPWRAYNRRLQRARALLRDEIARRRADPTVGERTDVLSALVLENELDDGELLDQLATLLLAGHDTSATALAWTLELLLRHPAALARARSDDLYLDAVVKESLRLRPVLPAITRRAVERVEIGGYELPAGTTVMPCIRLAHLAGERFPDPGSFRPERFLEGPVESYTWIPFGGGTRRCIGAAFAAFQMRTVLRTILQNAELQADRPAAERVANEHITLVPGRGCRAIKLARRGSGGLPGAMPVPARADTGCDRPAVS